MTVTVRLAAAAELRLPGDDRFPVHEQPSWDLLATAYLHWDWRAAGFQVGA